MNIGWYNMGNESKIDETPKISIIVPVYNVEKYICRCIDSILNQTFSDFELILVDDGSPDNCPQICDYYFNMDNRVKVIHKENGGVSSARNAGLDIAKGEYIAFVDSDDWIEEDMYQILYNTSVKYDADVVECDIFFIYNHVDNINKCINGETQIGNRDFALERIMKIPSSNFVYNKLYKRYTFKNLRFPNAKRFEDVYITYKIILKTEKYIYINSKKYYYFIRENSLSHMKNYSTELLEAIYSQEERFYSLKKNVVPKYIIDLAEQRYLLDLLRHYRLLSKNCRSDEDNKHLNNIRKLIIDNYNGFMNNKLLRKERKWITTIRINKTLYLNMFSIYEQILVVKNYLMIICTKLKFLVKHILI